MTVSCSFLLTSISPYSFLLPHFIVVRLQVGIRLTSLFCYSGRTERQALADASNRPQPKVVRTPSRRHQRRLSGSENQPHNNQSNCKCKILFNL